jgi:hypothetical protein
VRDGGSLGESCIAGLRLSDRPRYWGGLERLFVQDTAGVWDLSDRYLKQWQTAKHQRIHWPEFLKQVVQPRRDWKSKLQYAESNGFPPTPFRFRCPVCDRVSVVEQSKFPI